MKLIVRMSTVGNIEYYLINSQLSVFMVYLRYYLKEHGNNMLSVAQAIANRGGELFDAEMVTYSKCPILNVSVTNGNLNFSLTNGTNNAKGPLDDLLDAVALIEQDLFRVDVNDTKVIEDNSLKEIKLKGVKRLIINKSDNGEDYDLDIYYFG